jgi:hypothetical protein
MYLIFVCVFDTRRTVHGTMKQPTVFAWKVIDLDLCPLLFKAIV